jgi:acetyltransferase-like isoleucine patch superfamily enzyme
MVGFSSNKIALNRVLALFLKKQFFFKIARFKDLLALVCSSHYSTSISIGAQVVGRNIFIGKNTLLEEGCMLAMHNPSAKNEFIKIGDDCEIRMGAQIRSWMGSITIGNECSINPNTILLGTGGIVIGNRVRIAGNSLIVASSHIFSDLEKPIINQGYTAIGVNIKDDCWIGAGVCILDGVTIESGCILGAGAVVNKSTNKNGIYAGVPARKIGER